MPMQRSGTKGEKFHTGAYSGSFVLPIKRLYRLGGRPRAVTSLVCGDNDEEDPVARTFSYQHRFVHFPFLPSRLVMLIPAVRCRSRTVKRFRGLFVPFGFFDFARFPSLSPVGVTTMATLASKFGESVSRNDHSQQNYSSR